MDQEGKDGQQQQSGGLWVAGIFFVALVFLLIVLGGYIQEWKWTGLPKRTLWDWLDLLIVPVVLAIGGYLFTRSENRATQAAAERRTQDEAFQAYLDQLGQLLLDKERSLRESEKDDEVRTLGRARTLTVLRRLDSERRGRVLQFLYEARLIDKDHPVLDLAEADLSEANLIEVYLRGANLNKVNLSKAHLSGAVLRGAVLSGAELNGADLSRAKMYEADLSNAHLGGADLSKANLPKVNLRTADLSKANLSNAHLSEAKLGANLSEANLIGANLSKADLENAKGTTNEQLKLAKTLEGATMPNGQKYEDWIKDKAGSGKNVENK